jgi:hypothetical protein
LFDRFRWIFMLYDVAKINVNLDWIWINKIIKLDSIVVPEMQKLGEIWREHEFKFVTFRINSWLWKIFVDLLLKLIMDDLQEVN